MYGCYMLVVWCVVRMSVRSVSDRLLFENFENRKMSNFGNSKLQKLKFENLGC